MSARIGLCHAHPRWNYIYGNDGYNVEVLLRQMAHSRAKIHANNLTLAARIVVAVRRHPVIFLCVFSFFWLAILGCVKVFVGDARSQGFIAFAPPPRFLTSIFVAHTHTSPAFVGLRVIEAALCVSTDGLVKFGYLPLYQYCTYSVLYFTPKL